MSTDRTALVIDSVTVDPLERRASIAMNLNGNMVWQPLRPHDPRAAAALIAYDQAEGMIRRAGERRDIRNSTVLDWAASLAVKFVARGLDASLAGSYGSTYAHQMAALPVEDALRRAIHAGIEPDIPNAGELERMATVAERNRLTSAINRMHEIKAITVGHGPAAAQPKMDLVRAQYPQLQKMQGFTIQAYEPGAVIPKELTFSTFPEAVAAFREIPASAHARLCEHDRPLIWRNTEVAGPALKFASDKVQNAYFDSLLSGVGSISISSNLADNQRVHQSIAIASGSVDQFRATLATMSDNSPRPGTQTDQGYQQKHQPRLGR